MKKRFLISVLLILLITAVMSLGISALDKEKRTEYSSAGDVNGDGSIKGNDATILLKYLAGWNVKINEYFSDTNGNGELKGNDATFLLKYLADWDVQPTLYREWYNILDYSAEIKTDGTTDISPYLAACLGEHDNVFIPEGEYKFTQTITLKENQGVKGTDKTKLITNGQMLFSAGGRYDAEKDEVDFIENILVDGFDIYYDGFSGTKAVGFGGCRNITVSNIRVENMGLAVFSTAYPEIFSVEGEENFIKYLSNNFIVNNCYGNGNVDTSTGEWLVCIDISCGKDFIIRDTEIYNYGNGIVYTGGDASTLGTIPGRLSFMGKNTNGLFYGLTIDNIRWGGLWGTFGTYLTVKKCRITNCNDVGVDMEGCQNCLVTENYFKNCVYNFGAPDQFAGNVTFSYNTSVQTTEKNFLLHFDGHTSWDCEYAYDWQKIYIEHNTFISEGKIGLVAATYFCRGPALGHLCLRDNEFINTVYSSVAYPESVTWEDATDYTYRLDLWEQVIEGNNFNFTYEDENLFVPDYLAEYYPGVINIIANTTTEGAPCIISVKNNTVNAKVGFPCGIWIEHGETKLDYEATCSGNKISSVFDNGIAIVNVTENKLTVTVEDNTADSIIVSGVNIVLNENNNLSNAGKKVNAE